LNDAYKHAIENLPPLREIIKNGGLQATKALGQNFLLDINLTCHIARLNGELDGLDVIEIGPGPGGLTRALLLENAAHVHAIEYDERAVTILQPLIEASNNRLTIHHGDALKINPLSLGNQNNRAIIANLPYNVATPILINLLRDIHANKNTTRFMLLMFQKEVADRITAHPDSKTFGRLAVMAQWLCHVKTMKIIPPGAFTPPPKIHSAVVRFIPRDRTDSVQFETMEKILATAFNQRRKMLRQSLKDYIKHLEITGIEPTLRAEDVTTQDYIRLAQSIETTA
jgi:16S rRNA (adenine1518-N6/adenine1519-N6)-dimethyltransferase